MNRRDFLNVAGSTILAGGASAYGVKLLTDPKASSDVPPRASTTARWGMVIDLNKCLPECTACMDACRKENNVAFHGDDRWDIHWIRKVRIRHKHAESTEEKTVLLMCNHCDNPPCAQVCPVQATFKRHDGIVIVDQHRCIGCRYCVMSCFYNARYFNFHSHELDWDDEGDGPNRPPLNKEYPKRNHGIAESCNFCAHLLDRGEKPKCVTTCEGIANALTHGDLDDPTSEVSRLIAEHAPKRIREDLHTEPKVYYIGL